MRILIYKRTHTGDPGPDGIFGSNGCMGRMLNMHFDAVIGIGSLRPWRDSIEIAGRITWVGVTPIVVGRDTRGNLLKFERFRLFEGHGPLVKDVAPLLAEYFYGTNPRFVMDGLSDEQHREAQDFLASFESYAAPDLDAFMDIRRYPRGIRKMICNPCDRERESDSGCAW